ALLLAAAAQDRAAARVVGAGAEVHEGGDNGSLIAAAALGGLCGRALKIARSEAAAPRTPRALRNDINDAFAEPLRLEADRRARQQAARERIDRAAQQEGPAQAAPDPKDEEDAVQRVLEALMKALTRPR